MYQIDQVNGLFINDEIWLDDLSLRILQILMTERALTRNEIGEKLGYKYAKGVRRTTIYDHLEHPLESNKLITRFAIPTNKRGRPIVFWQLVKGVDSRIWDQVKTYQHKCGE